MTETTPDSSGYSPRQLPTIHRLVPAWITENFLPVADILGRFGSSQPKSAWSPDGGALPDERLRAMHGIWQAQAEGREMPMAHRCDPSSFGELAGIMMFLDFEEGGLALGYRHYGAELAAHSGKNWQGRTTADMARFSDYSLLFASSYLASAVLREPLYTELVSAPKLVSTTWCRYLMPYENEEGRVVSFACANLPIQGLPDWPDVEGRVQVTKNRALAGGADSMDLAAALARMEANVRDILARSPSAVLVVAPEARLAYFLNEPMAALAGRRLDEIWATDPGALFVDPGDFELALRRSRAGEAPRDLETRLRRADGSEAWALMSAYSLVFDGNPCVAFWFYDISERKAAEQALLEAERAKEETIRQLVEAQAELKRQADRDSLTGIPNRRYFYDISARELERARRYSTPLSLLMVDIDFFKRVNDEHGHPAGDEVLRLVTRVLDSRKRGSDFLARFGGEEFILLLPETDAEGASFLAEKLRAEVASARTGWEGGELRVTISVGAGTLGEEDEDIDSLVKAADDALYEAKREGRNRVVTRGRRGPVR